MTSVLERSVRGRVQEALTDTPVVAINGARQVGKSTLLALLTSGRQDTDIITLDDLSQLRAAQEDPDGFVHRPGRVLAIDEIQLVPRLMRSIKAEVDRDRRPGRFIITGSTRLLATPGMSESLAGRIEILELWPLTRAEINGSPGDFVDRLFNGVGAVGVSSTLAKQDYMELACIGGFPEATKRTGTRRRAWFQNYVDGVIERVVSEVADIRREGEIPQLFKLCAARSGQEVNVADLGAELGLPARTANAYLSHLSTVFLVQLIPAWSTNITAKVVRKPKLMAIDSGLAAHALGHDAVSLQSPNAPLGPVMETFAVMELRKLIANSS